MKEQNSFVVFCLFWYSLFFSFFFSPYSINLMKNKLDPEGLGIILLGPFLQEFFPDQVTYSTEYIDSFVLLR